MPSILLVGLALLGTAPAAAERGEISLLGFYASGDYGTDANSDLQSMTLRYLTGRRVQFRLDLPMISRDGTRGALCTGLGRIAGGTGAGPGGPGPNGDGPSGLGGNPSHGSAAIAATSEGSRETGLGDVRLAVARRLNGGGVKLFRTDATLELKLPTADEDAGLGTGELDARAVVSGEIRSWSVTGFGGIGWNRIGDPSWIELNDVFDAFLGVETNPLAGERLVLSGWVEGHEEVVRGSGSHLALGLGMRTTGSTRWRVSVTTEVGGSYDETTVLIGPSFGARALGPGIRGVER